jgi:hypothetical protein
LLTFWNSDFFFCVYFKGGIWFFFFPFHGKFLPNATKTHVESGGKAPPFVTSALDLRWVVNFAPQPRYPQGKSPWFLLDRPGEGQSRVGCCGVQKILLSLLGLEPQASSPYPFAIPTGLNVSLFLYFYVLFRQQRLGATLKQFFYFGGVEITSVFVANMLHYVSVVESKMFTLSFCSRIHWFSFLDPHATSHILGFTT